MGLTPGPIAAPERDDHRAAGWQRKVTALLFAIFCAELGLFLLIYPWTDAWMNNRFATFAGETYWKATVAAWWREIWPSSYFRGALSGLGLVNLWIATGEVLGLRRFAAREDDYATREDDYNEE
jgi:hypothetical protein